MRAFTPRSSTVKDSRCACFRLLSSAGKWVVIDIVIGSFWGKSKKSKMNSKRFSSFYQWFSGDTRNCWCWSLQFVWIRPQIPNFSGNFRNFIWKYFLWTKHFTSFADSLPSLTARSSKKLGGSSSKYFWRFLLSSWAILNWNSHWNNFPEKVNRGEIFGSLRGERWVSKWKHKFGLIFHENDFILSISKRQPFNTL